MSYNPNFYNIYGNNATFQSLPPVYVPPPPPPPAYYFPQRTAAPKQVLSDQDIIKKFEVRIPREPTQVKVKTLSISEVREEMRKLVLTLNEVKAKQNVLLEKVTQLPDDEWNTHVAQIEENKQQINKTLFQINGPHLVLLQKLLAKRSAKRLRLKRRNLELREEKEQRIKDLKEKSRQIDENLQKIQDDINRVKQEEQAKLQADMVLKEVLRKKGDAKKCITKLDALVKLRKARQNTARGRGENVPESDGAAFNANIEKLKSLWAQKLVLYEKEEADLRATLKEEQTLCKSETEKQVASNLDQWWGSLFGGTRPQADFGGNRDQFLNIRAQWDKYISSEGSPLPVGWVPPAPNRHCLIKDTQNNV
ncbi:unnamed protein product [Chrysodeixis includens]|uniref:Programmed cell death protein 7 n=1 Tax=Chrysodeixis includens TaxID=689277 RepID=A0A9P0FQR6_CHRIL|nr:unnamed protein product [Chrysodeixis includens]